MIVFLIVLHTIVSILLISVVLMQASQGGGLSGTFGGQAASSILGGQSAGNVLSKITTWLAVIFIGLAILISTLTGPPSETGPSLLRREAENNPVQQQQQQSVLPDQEEDVLDLGD